MLDIARGHRTIKYIFFEILPSFFIGVIVFISILLMFQALRLTEFVLVHGVALRTVGEIMLYLSVSFLPVIFPMSLLFAVLLTYSRLSADSEIVVFKALGLNMKHIVAPAVLVSSLTAFFSAETSFYLAPWGNRQFEVLINDLAQLKASVQIREGVFSEGIKDLVIYANQVDEKTGHLHKVFIYDERDPSSPLTIIAREGAFIRELTPAGYAALLQLREGNLHRTSNDTYTKVDFNAYNISLFDPVEFSQRQKSLPSHNINELKEALEKPDLEQGEKVKLQVEYHRRWALAVACFIFGFLGVGLGTSTNKRSGKSSGMILCIGIIVSYWILYVLSEGLARNGILPAPVAIWSVNALFAISAAWSLRSAST